MKKREMQKTSSNPKVSRGTFIKKGAIDTKVINVSSNAIDDEQRGLFYQIQLRIAKNTIRLNDKQVKSISEKTVMAVVQTGKQRIIEFFLTLRLNHSEKTIGAQ